MPTERWSEEEIRRALASERAQLAEAVADLRASVAAKRRKAAGAGAALLAGIAALAGLALARRRRDR